MQDLKPSFYFRPLNSVLIDTEIYCKYTLLEGLNTEISPGEHR